MTHPEALSPDEREEDLAWDSLDGGCRVAKTEFGTYSAWEDGCLKLPAGENRYFEGGINAAMLAAWEDYAARRARKGEG